MGRTKTTTKTTTAKAEKGKINVENAMDRVVEMFVSGDLPAAIARTTIARQNGHRNSDCWSISNQMIMYAAGTSDARGYRQWKAVGRTVNKGAKAFHILAPIIVKDRSTDEGENTEGQSFLVGFRGMPVFRVEDTQGEPVEVPVYEPVELPPLIEVAEKFKVPVSYAPWMGTAYGSYAWETSTLTGEDADQRIILHTHDVGTYFHELAHAAHARIETLSGKKGSLAYSQQEVVAETVAAVLSLMYGGEGRIAGSREYVEAYSGQNAGKAAMKVLKTVQQVLSLILGGDTTTTEVK